MISKIEFKENDTFGFEAKGEITQKDYLDQIKPVFEKARNEGLKLRILFYFGPDYKGFSSGAAWEDFKIGLRHLRTVERCAIVSDIVWIRNLSQFLGALVPCTVQTHKIKDLSSAKAWLTSGEIGLDEHLNENTGVLSVNITGPLTSQNFEILTDTVDRFLEKDGELKGIVIRSKTFPGWDNIGGFLSHFEFVKNHHRKIRKVALVVDGAMATLIPEVAKHFVEAEVKHFKFEDNKEATTWAAG